MPPAKKTGGSPLMLIISGVLAVALIAVGVLYVMEMGKLKKANDNISSLETNVTSLEGQLATEKASVASLQTQLATEKANVATLQTQLNTAKSDLTASQAKVTSLTADLAAANASVTNLTASLATANAKVTSTQTSLDKANADLATAVATNASQTTELKKVKDPRFFDTLAELTAWLAKDDTNTNPVYASYNAVTKAYILQIKALRDGYLIGAYGGWAASSVYYDNTTLAGGVLVEIDVLTDLTVVGPAWTVPSHPLPIP